MSLSVTKKLIILGSTGSIGRSTLEVVDRMRDRFQVIGLAAGSNASLLLEQIVRFKPKIVSIREEKEIFPYREELSQLKVKLLTGERAAEELVSQEEVDIVVAAITGIEGLKPTLAALRSAKRLALANKESMVVAGRLVLEQARLSGAEIIPIDSEHCGVYQCLRKERKKDIRRVILTASGGPFFQVPLSELAHKTVDEALAHPRWKMGKKVTIDSATLMNKGLELIEARWLFNLKPEQLDILIHPQSIVHALVELVDGSVLAQLSVTDMKLPIQFALCYPKRERMLLAPLNLDVTKRLEFYAVDEERYPLVRLARRALREEGSLSIALNAANEMAVNAFLEGKISFPEIVSLVQTVVHNHQPRRINGLDEIIKFDREVREQMKKFILQRN